MLLELEIDKELTPSWHVLPMVIKECQPTLANDKEAEKIIGTVIKNSHNQIELEPNGTTWTVR